MELFLAARDRPAGRTLILEDRMDAQTSYQLLGKLLGRDPGVELEPLPDGLSRNV